MSKSFKSVKEFEYPAKFGFKGSDGKKMVKGYCRGEPKPKFAEGGRVEKPKAPPPKPPEKKPAVSLEGVVKGKNPFMNEARRRALEGYAEGGPVKKGLGGMMRHVMEKVKDKSMSPGNGNKFGHMKQAMSAPPVVAKPLPVPAAPQGGLGAMRGFGHFNREPMIPQQPAYNPRGHMIGRGKPKMG